MAQTGGMKYSIYLLLGIVASAVAVRMVGAAAGL